MSPAVGAVAVIGAGTVGAGWATVFARAGIEVRLHDTDCKRLANARERIAEALALLAEEGLEPRGNAGLVAPCSRLEDAVAGADYVQEALPETLELKQDVFAAVDALTPAHVIVGSSASALRASDICATMRRAPGRGLVVHPTNPPHIVPLVELVAGERTAPVTVDAAHALMLAIGQRPIVCRRDIYGFVLNRLQMALAREAFWLAREGVATVPDIDAAISDGLGLRWALLGQFGVEETNGESIAEDLRKFGPHMRALMDDVRRHGLTWPTARDLELATDGIAEMYPGVTHEQLLEYRDRMVLRIRALKAAFQPAACATSTS